METTNPITPGRTDDTAGSGAHRVPQRPLFCFSFQNDFNVRESSCLDFVSLISSVYGEVQPIVPSLPWRFTETAVSAKVVIVAEMIHEHLLQWPQDPSAVRAPIHICRAPPTQGELGLGQSGVGQHRERMPVTDRS